jgi:hypothetical protein
MNKQIKSLKQQIRALTLFFMIALALSGATAIPVEQELNALLSWFPANNDLSRLLHRVLDGLSQSNTKFPFLLYGYDWLAFAHFVIAILFAGVLRDPVRNIWVVEFGMIACALIIPYAFVFSAYRGLPVWWSVVDSSFGIFGMVPLYFIRTKILVLQHLRQEEKFNLIF